MRSIVRRGELPPVDAGVLAGAWHFGVVCEYEYEWVQTKSILESRQQGLHCMKATIEYRNRRITQLLVVES